MDQVTQLQNLQEAVDSRPWILLKAFVAISLLELYSLFPGERYQVEEKRFWLDDTAISFQTWVDYASTRAAICVFIALLRECNPQYRKEFNVLFWLMFGYLIDYFVIYNNPFARIGFVPISYTLFMLILSGITVWRAFQKSWT